MASNAWVVLGACLVNIVIAYAIRFNFSLFYVSLLDEFKWERGATAAAVSVNLVVYSLGAPIIGGLVDRVGIRKIVPVGGLLLGATLVGFSYTTSMWQLYLWFGLTAIGTVALGYVPHAAILPNWFTERRGLAIGILTAGLGASMMLAPLVEHFISVLTWRGTVLAMAAISAAIPLPLAIFILKDRPGPKGLAPGDITPSGEQGKRTSEKQLRAVDRSWTAQDWTLRRALRTHRFWHLALATVLFGVGFYTLIIHQVLYLKDAGFDLAFAARVAGMFGILGAVGALCSFTSDRIGREATFSVGATCAIIGVIILALVERIHGWWAPYLYVTLFGLGYGLAGTQITAGAADLFQGRHFGVINGFLTGTLMAGGALGPWLAGHIYDLTTSYSIALVLVLLSLAVMVLSYRFAAPGRVRAVPGKSRV